MNKWETLNEFCLDTKSVAYNEELKAQFQRVGKAGLKEFAIALEATGRVKNCKLDYNKAGIACSGDFHVRGDFSEGGSFDFFFNLDGFNRFFTYRKTTNQRDYTGGRNIYMPFGTSLEDAVEDICLLNKKQNTDRGIGVYPML